MDYFQDDIFVPTANTEASVLTAEEWFGGHGIELPLIDLKPKDMIPCLFPPGEG